MEMVAVFFGASKSLGLSWSEAGEAEGKMGRQCRHEKKRTGVRGNKTTKWVYDNFIGERDFYY